MSGIGTKHGNKKRGSLHRFYLVHGKDNCDMEPLVDGLISLKPVEEVSIGDGDYGLLVKVRFQNGQEPKDVVNYIARNINRRYGVVDSYYQYRKR